MHRSLGLVVWGACEPRASSAEIDVNNRHVHACSCMHVSIQCAEHIVCHIYPPVIVLVRKIISILEVGSDDRNLMASFKSQVRGKKGRPCLCCQPSQLALLHALSICSVFCLHASIQFWLLLQILFSMYTMLIHALSSDSTFCAVSAPTAGRAHEIGGRGS